MQKKKKNRKRTDRMAEEIVSFVRSNRIQVILFHKCFSNFLSSTLAKLPSHNHYIGLSCFSIVIKVLNIYWEKIWEKLYVLLHACKMYTPHLPCYIRERRKERYIYEKEREKRGYVNLLLIKLYLNSQIRSSILFA